MTTIITRTSKGSSILATEMDTNFNNLNNYKAEDTDVRSTIKPTLNLDFANSKTLDPRITYTRASAATYYDGKTVAFAEQNSLIYSQTFQNGQWNKVNTSAIDNSAVAPDGTNTATTFTFTGAGGYFNQTPPTITMWASLICTWSIYLKAGTMTSARVYVYCTSGGANFYIDVDLTTGNVTSNVRTTSYSVNAVGNGWYRCVVTGNTNGAYYQANAVVVYNNTSTGTLYAWGGQFEQRTYVINYTPTTSVGFTNYIPVMQTANNNVARFDVDSVTGESKGLLIELGNANYLLYSQDFTNSNWIKTNATITANSTIAPDGSNTAAKLVNANTTNGFIYQTCATSVSTTAPYYYYNYSIHIKAAELSNARIQIVSGPNSAYVDVNLSTGTLGNVSNSGIIVTNSAIKNVGNGWYRASLGFTSSAAVTSSFVYSTLTGNGYSGIYIWGAQINNLSSPASYTPTTSAITSRSSETAYVNMSNIYNPQEGSLIVVTTPLDMTPYSFGGCVGIGAYNGFSGFSIYRENNQSIWYFLASNSKGQVQYTTSIVPVNVQSSLGTSYSSSTINNFYNGSINTWANPAIGPLGSLLSPYTYMYIGGNLFGNSQSYSGTFKKIAYYPKQLTNTQMQALTT